MSANPGPDLANHNGASMRPGQAAPDEEVFEEGQQWQDGRFNEAGASSPG